MIIKPHANRKNMFSKCHIESFFLCDMWKNQKRSKFLYPCNDFEQKFIHQKNSFKISLLGLNFSIILQKVPSKPPLKITLTNRLCKIKLNNKKKYFKIHFTQWHQQRHRRQLYSKAFFHFSTSYAHSSKWDRDNSFFSNSDTPTVKFINVDMYTVIFMSFICHYVARMSGKYTYREQIERLVIFVGVDMVGEWMSSR